MYGEKNKLKKLSLLFSFITFIFLIVLIILTFNIEKIFDYYQENTVDELKEELETILDEAPSSQGPYSEFVDKYNTELIVLENEKLIYTSVGTGDIKYIDNIFSKGYMYKALYEYEDYTIWVNVYENVVLSFVNVAIIAIMFFIIAFALIVLGMQFLFFRKVSRPLLQLSYLINEMKNSPKLEKKQELDNIARELVIVSNEISLSLSSAQSKYNEIELEYINQRELGTEQAEHLKTALHDVKNPLTAIKSSSYVLSRHTELDEEKLDIINEIKESSVRAHSYITETLNIIINNMSEIYNTVEKINILCIINDIYEVSSLYASTKDVTLNIIGEDFEIVTNRLKFNQLLSNLIYNALKYCPVKTKIDIILSNGTIQIINYIDRNVEPGNGFGLNRVANIADELNLEVEREFVGDKYIVAIVV